MVGELMMLPVRVGVRATRLWFRAVEETVSVTTSATGRLIGVLGSRGSDRAAVVAPQPTERDTFPPAQAPEPVREPRAEPGTGTAPPATAPPVEPALPPVEPVQPPVEPMQPPVEPAQPPVETSPTVEPAHVSEEPALVEEFAEPGAEDGAGAEVHVDPPWDGYERMNAREIVARLGGADAAELAAVELYEVTTRRRRTILNAVERELRRVNGSGSRRNQG